LKEQQQKDYNEYLLNNRGKEMLSVNVGTLLQQESGSKKIVAIDDVVENGNDRFLVKGTVRLCKTNRFIVAEADLVATSELTCMRCLNKFISTFTVKFTDEFYTKDNLIVMAREGNREDDLEDFFTVDGRNILDLSEAIRQYAIMSEPLKPICTENCDPLRQR